MCKENRLSTYLLYPSWTIETHVILRWHVRNKVTQLQMVIVHRRYMCCGYFLIVTKLPLNSQFCRFSIVSKHTKINRLLIFIKILPYVHKLEMWIGPLRRYLIGYGIENRLITIFNLPTVPRSNLARGAWESCQWSGFSRLFLRVRPFHQSFA